MSFANMKNNRTKNIGDLAAKAKEAFEGKKSYSKDDFWKLEVNSKTGNGQATLRFLPAKNPESSPWITYYDYFFKNPKNGQFYVEKSLSTLGQPDPVGEFTSEKWNSGEEGKKFIRANQMTRNLNYVANIYVVDHPGRPEDNGKVFKYKFGKKIFGKINEAMCPEFEGDDPINPFDFWEGANFQLRRKKVEGWANYDQSFFDKPSVLLDDDAKLEEIYNSAEDIDDLIAADKFKSYDELKTKFNRVMGLSANAPQASYASSEREEAPAETESQTPADETPSTPADEASEDSLSYFQQLANQ